MFLPELGSFVAAMLFAVQPIHTEAVSSVCVLVYFLLVKYSSETVSLNQEKSSRLHHNSTVVAGRSTYVRYGGLAAKSSLPTPALIVVGSGLVLTLSPVGGT